MKKKSFKPIGYITGIIILATSVLGFAQEGGKIKVQGKVMDLDLKGMVITVCEKTFVMDQTTIIYNEKGSRIANDRLKPKSRVYVVGEKDPASKRLVARKIYLLSKRIPNKEKHLYPFMQDTPSED